jgi:coenzyme F420-reducing hydrogenase beta subunit
MDMSLSEHWNQIPQVIRDAIEFVEKIGVKYLWVDTLCIVQDSESRHVEIGRMNEIYQKAVCTLVALDEQSR